MITELASQEKVIGVKQSRKAIREGRAKRVARRAGSAWARPWWPSSPHKEMVFFGIASPRSVKNKGCRGHTAAKL